MQANLRIAGLAAAALLALFGLDSLGVFGRAALAGAMLAMILSRLEPESGRGVVFVLGAILGLCVGLLQWARDRRAGSSSEGGQ